MTKTLITSLLIILSFFASCSVCRRDNIEGGTWSKIARYFSVPQEYAGKYGQYRSPLIFRDGKLVKNKREWKKRRQEIKEEWMDAIGKWPPPLTAEKFEICETSVRENFVQHKVRLRWLPEDTTYAYLLIPERKGKKPAVITVFYEPETAVGLGPKPHRDFAYQLAKRGFVTLSLGTKKTTEQKTYSLYYPSIENSEIQPLSVLAYAASNALETLARHKEVDADRIGIAGHSYGGKWAMFASCLNDKFACAAWSDPGIVFDETKGAYINYWEPWYLGYYPLPWKNVWAGSGEKNPHGAYHKLRDSGHDLHELHALMAPRPFLVSGGYSDGPQRWLALNHTVAVNRLLGYENRVGMTNRLEHDPNPESNRLIYEFFECFLK